jgi:hypothetical protein
VGRGPRRPRQPLHYAVEVLTDDTPAGDDAGASRELLPSRRLVLAALRAGGPMQTVKQLGDHTAAQGHQLKRRTIQDALTELEERGLVVGTEAASGLARYWSPTSPSDPDQPADHLRPAPPAAAVSACPGLPPRVVSHAKAIAVVAVPRTGHHRRRGGQRHTARPDRWRPSTSHAAQPKARPARPAAVGSGQPTQNASTATQAATSRKTT